RVPKCVGRCAIRRVPNVDLKLTARPVPVRESRSEGHCDGSDEYTQDGDGPEPPARLAARCLPLHVARFDYVVAGGSVMLTVVPLPTVLSMSIVPPCAVMMSCVIARPRPEPVEPGPLTKR